MIGFVNNQRTDNFNRPLLSKRGQKRQDGGKVKTIGWLSIGQCLANCWPSMATGWPTVGH
eukprot:11189141-Lingulodinium_polyedra.AAC.1